MNYRILNFITLLWSVSFAKETLDEKLTIWPMPNRYNLLQFEYSFTIPLESDNITVDKFPRQVLDLINKTGSDVKRIEANLVQGRWQQALVPKIMGYQKEETNTVTRVLPDGFDHKEPGFSLAIDSLGSLSESDSTKIFGQIGSLLSVGIFDQRKQAIEIIGPTHPELFPDTVS